ncbi:MAG TPA: acetyl-CoA carboxylase carboxyltransferase subunit alpha [Syntrophomonadaceae bacterium]|nr:acetyl-CoA carboxylase carboxyltransferase subunit alpha [Syntrophomonadaceae bacterium]
MTQRKFDFESQYQGLKQKIADLTEESQLRNIDLSDEIAMLENKMKKIREAKYLNLSPWERVLLSRHPDRPGAVQYIERLCSEWIELHGDRLFGDDQAIIAALGLFHGQPVTLLGHRKGKNTADNLRYNFGMPHPEGYRKVVRLLQQAEKFGRPVLTFIDTPGAFPGIGAEERGQALAISQALMTLAGLKVPVISVVTGEGGSGGALALAVANRILMLSNSVFAVTSPESCSSILFKDPNRVEEMAAASKITANDLLHLGIADEVIEEPVGGANEEFEATACLLEESLQRNLRELQEMSPEQLVEDRYTKLRSIGMVAEKS